jgi:hypothetical protein
MGAHGQNAREFGFMVDAKQFASKVRFALLSGVGAGLSVPVANRRARARRAVPSQATERRGAGGCLFAHRGKPGWHSAAVFE